MLDLRKNNPSAAFGVSSLYTREPLLLAAVLFFKIVCADLRLTQTIAFLREDIPQAESSFASKTSRWHGIAVTEGACATSLFVLTVVLRALPQSPCGDSSLPEGAFKFVRT